MSSAVIVVKYSDDNEFDCIRRIMSKLGLSSPESDEDILCLSKYRSIERAINASFIDLNKLYKLAEENNRLREALELMLKAYCELVNSGDAGNWDPEGDREVINSRCILSELDGDKSSL